MNLDNRISAAISRAEKGNWGDLHRLCDDLRDAERARIEAVARLRHDVGNLLSIAQANVEAMLDGIVQATPERLDSVRESIVLAGDALNAFQDR